MYLWKYLILPTLKYIDSTTTSYLPTHVFINNELINFIDLYIYDVYNILSIPQEKFVTIGKDQIY